MRDFMFSPAFNAGMTRSRRNFLVCVLLCAVFLCCPAPKTAQAAKDSAPVAKKHAKKAPHKSPAPRSAQGGGAGWDFKESDKSDLNDRWRESINNTLSKTTFAPSAPAGRYLRQPYSSSGNLPPAHIEDLDKIRPPEEKQPLFGNANSGISPEMSKESVGWRPGSDSSLGAPPLKEERIAGAYADLHPDANVEVKVGPEYHFNDSSLRPDQTGYSNKDGAGSMGMGMKFKLDF